jgi:hypothetical protein
VESKRKLLIITDNTPAIKTVTEKIAGIFGDSFENYTFSSISAEQFSATDLLPADAFILGCEMPKPPLFVYIEDLFEHINLAGRPCGIFSTNTRSIKYLSNLVRASEAALKRPFLVKNNVPDNNKLQNWVQSIIGVK